MTPEKPESEAQLAVVRENVGGAASSSSGPAQVALEPLMEEEVDRTRAREPEQESPSKPPAQRVRVEDIATQIEVQDLQNVDESLEAEAADSTLWQTEAPETDDYEKEKTEELDRLISSETYEEVTRDQAHQEGLKILKSGWVLTETGEKRKARFVAKEIAYKRTSADSRFFAATPSVMGLRLLLLMASLCGWGINNDEANMGNQFSNQHSL